MIWRIAVALGAIVAIAVGLLELRRDGDGMGAIHGDADTGDAREE